MRLDDCAQWRCRWWTFDGGAVTVATWKRRLGVLLDPAATDPQLTVDVAPDAAVAAVHRDLLWRFEADAALDRIQLRVGGAEFGIVTRATVGEDRGHLGADPPVLDSGRGDGATLPGFPGEFRPVRYVCPERRCGKTILRAFYDERCVVRCTEHRSVFAVYQGG